MKDELTFKDFVSFFKDNLKIIVGTILLFLFLIIGYVVYSHADADSKVDSTGSPVELTNIAISDERYEELAEWPLELYTDAQISQMQEYLLPRAYKVTFYAEHEDYEPIVNTTLMREVFRNNEVLEYVENQLGEQLTPAIEFAIHIENLANSGVYELHFQRGTQEESLELAYIVMDAIEEGVIPVLDSKTITFIEDEPELILQDYSEYFNGSAPSDFSSLQATLRDVLIYGVLALVVGLIIGILLALLSAISNPKIHALFDYAQEESDKIVRLTHLKKVNTEEKIQKGLKNINLPETLNKVVVYDESTKEEFKNLFTHLDSNISFYTDFSLTKENIENVDEIIILSLVNKTTKSWYANQRVQLKGYNIPVKIIQF